MKYTDMGGIDEVFKQILPGKRPMKFWQMAKKSSDSVSQPPPAGSPVTVNWTAPQKQPPAQVRFVSPFPSAALGLGSAAAWPDAPSAH